MKKGRLLVTAVAAALGVGLSVPAADAAPAGYNDIINSIRSVGSDTTFFLMQPLSDIYNSSPGCRLLTSGAPAFTQCDTAATPISTTENFDHDEVTQAAPFDVGSSAGINQMCGTVAIGNGLKAHMARSSRTRGTSTCEAAANNHVFFKGIAKDGIDVLHFPTVVSGSQGSPAAGCMPGQLAPSCTGIFKTAGTRRYTKENLIAIWGTGTVIDWCQLNNGTVAAGDGNDPQDPNPLYGLHSGNGGTGPCATAQPIVTWKVLTSSGTKATWDAFIGSDTNAHGDLPATGTIQENNAQPIVDAGVAIQQRTIHYGSNARFSAFKFTAGGGSTPPINAGAGGPFVSPSTSTIGGGTYPATRTLFNVTVNTANPPPSLPAPGVSDAGYAAGQAFSNWLCQASHAVSDDTGNNINFDLQKAYEKLFFVRLGGDNGAKPPATPVANSPCTNG